ncbi:protein-tyrosine-phosphatase [Sporanaerobium hydrogeniformans]|uniref:Protein-tyrosine-phosphatase n=1 Tax=Sporanaerobium hydrogeniformans TaxID=3072179 RepID=A0AC61DBM3_9FIRM|nr:low molecular weight protein-tyrosine-phosphatase [Sporanaerobium hydrogeniformans]PHV69962.1 protein-tyrosine-phosphatase [Sporanaerobium hydrogeniformans]
MIRVLFICHGNICRSPMAEFVFKDMVKQKGLEKEFDIASAATSTEEIGNSVHSGTRNKLNEYGISVAGKTAVQLKRQDYKNYDYLIAMDQRNITNMHRILGQDGEKKIYRLLDFTTHPRDIADPWYTGDFDLTYKEVYEGCEQLLAFLLASKKQKQDEVGGIKGE